MKVSMFFMIKIFISMSLGMKLVRAHRILNVNNLIYYFVSQKTFNKNFVVIHEIEVLTLDKPV